MKKKFTNWVKRNEEQLQKDFLKNYNEHYEEFCKIQFEYEIEEYEK